MAEELLEREAKLQAGVGFRVPDLSDVVPGGSTRSLPDQQLYAIYVDTEDLRMARAGVTLRHRRERGETGGEWTLKLPVASEGASLVRREIGHPGKWGPVPPELLSLTRAFRRTAPLVPVARLVTHRRRTLLCAAGGDPLLEVDDDVVSVMDGRRVAARFREVEVEVVGAATDQHFDAAVARLAGAGAELGAGQAKAIRALGYRAGGPPDVAEVRVHRSSPVREVARAAVAAGYLRLVAHDPAVRLSEDPEAVHQARVATRRMRSDLRTLAAVVDPVWTAGTVDELGWLAGALGRVRDADVLFENLESTVKSLGEPDAARAGGMLNRLAAEGAEARRELGAAMDSERYGRLLDRLAAAARELPAPPAGAEDAPAAPPGSADASIRLDQPALEEAPLGEMPPADGGAAAPDGSGAAAAEGARAAVAAGDLPAGEAARLVVAGPWRQLVRAVRKLGPHPSDEQLHDVRIRAKRLRYACEAFSQVAGRPAAQLGRAAADLQGVLGELHDAVVAEAWIRDAVAGATVDEGVAAGLLIARQRAVAAEQRARWVRVWSAVNRKRLRRWLS